MKRDQRVVGEIVLSKLENMLMLRFSPRKRQCDRVLEHLVNGMNGWSITMIMT